jgi:hypothetical protein
MNRERYQMDIRNLEVNNERETNPNVYHNTKLLLTLYGKVVSRINNDIQIVKEECAYELRKNLDDLIDQLGEVELYISRPRLENRRKSIENSKSLINLINKSLALMRSYLDIGERYYIILYNT